MTPSFENVVHAAQAAVAAEARATAAQTALAAEAAMAEHASALQERLLEALTQLDAIGAQLGRAGRSVWHPAQELVDALHKLHAQTHRGW